MPVLFEVFKWLLFQAGPKAAREGLAKVEEGVVVVPFTLEDLEEVCLLLARLPGWGAPWRTRAWPSSPCGLGRPFGR